MFIFHTLDVTLLRSVSFINYFSTPVLVTYKLSSFFHCSVIGTNNTSFDTSLHVFPTQIHCMFVTSGLCALMIISFIIYFWFNTRVYDLVWLVLWRLTPLSAIFQLYRGGAHALTTNHKKPFFLSLTSISFFFFLIFFYYYYFMEGFVLLSVTPLISSDFFKLRGVMVFNATFNNMSIISWRTVLLLAETGEY